MLPQHSSIIDSSLSYTLGEKFPGIPALSFTLSSTGLPPSSSTLSSATLRIRKKGSLTTLVTLSCTVVSSSNWTITLDASDQSSVISIDGDYDYKFKTVDSNSVLQSWFYGTFTVAAD